MLMLGTWRAWKLRMLDGCDRLTLEAVKSGSPFARSGGGSSWNSAVVGDGCVMLERERLSVVVEPSSSSGSSSCSARSASFADAICCSSPASNFSSLGVG